MSHEGTKILPARGQQLKKCKISVGLNGVKKVERYINNIQVWSWGLLKNSFFRF